MNSKKHFAFFVLAAAGVAVSEALFFGVSIQGTGGNTIAAANPVQTAAIGFFAAALGLLTLDFLRPQTAGRRGKRSAPQDTSTNSLLDEADIELLNSVFTRLDETDCYHRLVCDIAASGDNSNYASASIIDLIKFSLDVPMTSVPAEKGLLKLNRSVLFGERVKDVETCERVFSNCPHSGSDLDKLIALGKA